jgi:hypothetical protein
VKSKIGTSNLPNVNLSICQFVEEIPFWKQWCSNEAKQPEWPVLKTKKQMESLLGTAGYERYLILCIVNDLISDQTQVVTFLMGLDGGRIKTELF